MNRFEEAIQAAIKRGGHRDKDNPPKEGHHTIGELISAVFSIKTETDAKAFYEGYLEYLGNRWHEDDHTHDKHTPESVAQSNIGWCFGEGMDNKYIKMWSKVCNASHPVFGTALPTPEEAFAMGEKQGKAMRNKA